MKTIALLSALLAGFVINGCKTTYQDGDALIWSEERKLQYSDFRKYRNDNTQYRAYCLIPLKMDYLLDKKGQVKKFKVFALLIRSKSWFRDTSQYVLNHEQGHFDIGEVHARRLRKDLSLIKSTNKLVNYRFMDSVFQKYVAKLAELQQQYDSETDGSHNYYEQQKWDLKIRSLLVEYSEYK